MYFLSYKPLPHGNRRVGDGLGAIGDRQPPPGAILAQSRPQLRGSRIKHCAERCTLWGAHFTAGQALEGDISPYMLLTLSASELASDKARAENEKIRLAALEESVRGQTTQARARAHPPAAFVGGTD